MTQKTGGNEQTQDQQEGKEGAEERAGKVGGKEEGMMGRWRREMKRKEEESEGEEEGGTKEGRDFKQTRRERLKGHDDKWEQGRKKRDIGVGLAEGG